MKKLVAFLLCSVLAVGAVGGCGNKQEVEKRQEVKQEANEVEHKGIAGSSYVNLTIPLEKIGFPKHDISPVDEDNIVVIPVVTYEDESGMVMRYYMSYYGVGSDYLGEIEGAVFSIENGIDIEPESFIELAKSYLSFCSSMPYDSAEPEKVMEWVKENIEDAGNGKDGGNIEITVGDAKFILTGNDLEDGTYGERTLRIEKVIV